MWFPHIFVDGPRMLPHHSAKSLIDLLFEELCGVSSSTADFLPVVSSDLWGSAAVPGSSDSPAFRAEAFPPPPRPLQPKSAAPGNAPGGAFSSSAPVARARSNFRSRPFGGCGSVSAVPLSVSRPFAFGLPGSSRCDFVFRVADPKFFCQHLALLERS